MYGCVCGIDAKRGYSTTGQGYGASWVLARIDELGECIIDNATPGKCELLAAWASVPVMLT
jgi:hypothetical protein